jgi:sugar lactone lactonase YvrE
MSIGRKMADNELIIEQIGDARYLLGEGPLWDGRENVLYWVDVLQNSIWRHRPNTDEFRQWDLPGAVSSLALRENGNAVVTLADGFYEFNFDTNECRLMGDTYEKGAPSRFNDGKVDRAGRFVAGTMHNEIAEPIGSLYSLGTDGVVSILDTGIKCTNGPCWSLDNKTMYFSDTPYKTIFAYEYHLGDGTVGPRREFANFRELGIEGFPDGSTVDSEGYVWSAVCTAGALARIAPDGSLDRVIEMPVKFVTSVMFGGEKLDTLYVTSLNHPLNGNPPEEPNAGGLFAVHGLGITGVPEPQYGG